MEGECSNGVPVNDGLTLGKEVNAGVVETNSMEDESSDFVKPGVRQSESSDGSDRGISNMCAGVLAYGARLINGDAEANGMEFEGGGENPNSC